MQNKIKKSIIHVTPYFPPTVGGMQTVTYQVTSMLSLKGYSVTVVTSKFKNAINYLKNTENLKIRYLDAFELFNTPIIPGLTKELLGMPKNSIVHIHIAHIFTPEITSLIAKIRGIPYVAHIHGTLTSYSSFEKFLFLYKKIILKKVLKHATYIIVPTEDYKNDINKKFYIQKEKIIVIPSSLQVKIRDYTNKKIGSPIKLLFIGRLVEQKNPLLLINIMKKLQNRNINAVLTIVGEGELKNQLLMEIKNNKLEDSVEIRPYLRGDKLSDIYSNSDVLLFPSHWETFGTVLIEAMASGLPVIANNIPGVKNIIASMYNGLLVDGTIKSFCDAILQLSKNQTLYNNLRINGLKDAKKYDLNITILKYEDLYAKI